MTDKHPTTTRRTLACMLTAAVVANAPRAGHAAPANAEPVRNPAAEAVALFEEGTVLEREGDKKAAADRYRAAAEANGALHEAEDPASAAHVTFVARTIKGYDAAFNLSDRPALMRSASDWCTKNLVDNAEDPTSVKIREKCAQWGWQPPPGPSAAPPGPETTRTDGQSETGTRPGAVHSDNRGTTPPSLSPPSPPKQSPPPSKPWRGLSIAGGCTLAGGTVFLVLALTGAVRQLSLEGQDNSCTLPYDDRCTQLIKKGEALGPLTGASVISGTLLTGTGAVLLTIAMRRRTAKVALAPTLHSQFLGLTLRGRF